MLVIVIMASEAVKFLGEQWAIYETKVSPIGDAILTWARPDGFPVSPAELGNYPFQVHTP